MKRIISAILAAILLLALAGCNAQSMSNSWSHTSLNNEMTTNGWKIQAKSIDGYASRKLDFNAENLVAFHVDNTNSAGEVLLVISQDSVSQTFTISPSFSGRLDLGKFSPGKITVRLEFKKAKDIDLTIVW